MAVYSGTGAGEKLTGGTGNDLIYAGAGNDVAYGGAGDDTIYGGVDAKAAPNYVSVDAASQTVSGANGRADFKANSVSGDRELTAYDFYGVKGLWVGNGDSLETHTHTMSSQVAGGRVFFNATDWTDTVTISIDGAKIDLNAAIKTGMIRFDGAPNYSVNWSGQIVGALGGDALATGSFTINVPFTSFGISNSGLGNGTVYDLQVDTNPVGGAVVAGGDDVLFGGDGNDVIFTETGNDTVDGGAGNDSINGGAGRDSLAGGAGKDALFGGDGDDRLSGGLDDDSLGGGAGNDTFELVHAGGGDLISDFRLPDDKGVLGDQLDVSDLRNDDGSGVQTWQVKVADDGHGSTVLTFPQGESVVLEGVSPKAVTPSVLHSIGVPCFAAGTLILTPQGVRAVEDIAVGDWVQTAQGAMAVLWHGRRVLDAEDLNDRPQVRPVRIAAGAVGNARDLVLSPQHGVFVVGAGLIRARHLADFTVRARVMRGARVVRYHHLLLPRHALIWAEGALVESFYPGPMAMAALLPADRRAVAAVILGAGRAGGDVALAYGPRCAPLLSRSEARAILGGASSDLARVGESMSGLSVR